TKRLYLTSPLVIQHIFPMPYKVARFSNRVNDKMFHKERLSPKFLFLHLAEMLHVLMDKASSAALLVDFVNYCKRLKNSLRYTIGKDQFVIKLYPHYFQA